MGPARRAARREGRAARRRVCCGRRGGSWRATRRAQAAGAPAPPKLLRRTCALFHCWNRLDCSICTRDSRSTASSSVKSSVMSVVAHSSDCSARNTSAVLWLGVASPLMSPAPAGGDGSGGGCGWAAVRAEAVACCSALGSWGAECSLCPPAPSDKTARWRSLSCSSSAKSPTDGGGGGAVYSGCKLWPSAVSLGECSVSSSEPRACCASACLAARRECWAR